MQSFSNEPAIVVAACCFILMICSFLTVFVVSYQKKTFKFLQEKQAMESAFKEQLLQSRMEVQEDTLKAISKELHDNIGQLLSTTKMLIGITERSIEPSDTLTTASETLTQAINEVRALSRSFNKEWLAQFDVVQNLQAEINRINSANIIGVNLSTPQKILMPADEQIILFRIIQEALQNCLRHAQAQHVFVNISYNAKALDISIADDGKGFDIKNVKKGLGLMNITERSRILGGSAHWKNTQPGCQLSIEIPILPNNEN